MTNAIFVDSSERLFVGAMLALAAYTLFSSQDAAIRLLVVEIPVWQILFFRSAIVLAGCAAVGGRQLFVDAARSSIVKPMLGRSVLILVAWVCYYTAAKYLQLAELTTIYFGAPVMVTVMSIFILGERVPPLRWVAVVTGFAGVFVACDPANLGITLPVCLVLAAAFLWGLSIVLMRKIALHERTTIQLILNNIFFLAIAGAPMLVFWRTPSAAQWLLILSVGVLGGIAQYALFEGMKRAPVSVIAPMEYSALIWAFVFGYLIWGDIPRPEVFWGAALILLAGVVFVGGERLRRGPAGSLPT